MSAKTYYEDDTPRDVSEYLKMSHEERLTEIEKLEQEHKDKRSASAK